MKYQMSYYTDILLQVCRWYLTSLLSFQFAIAVVFTGLFAARMLQAFGEPQYLQDLIVVPCAMFFFWSLCMSIIDMNIERDTL
jgi:uncharacterized membrane protein YccC